MNYEFACQANPILRFVVFENTWKMITQVDPNTIWGKNIKYSMGQTHTVQGEANADNTRHMMNHHMLPTAPHIMWLVLSAFDLACIFYFGLILFCISVSVRAKHQCLFTFPVWISGFHGSHKI